MQGTEGDELGVVPPKGLETIRTFVVYPLDNTLTVSSY